MLSVLFLLYVVIPLVVVDGGTIVTSVISIHIHTFTFTLTHSLVKLATKVTPSGFPKVVDPQPMCASPHYRSLKRQLTLFPP